MIPEALGARSRKSPSGESQHPAARGVRVWRSPEWREHARRWLDDRLAEAGIERTGDVEQPRVRPWATVLRAPTTRGPVWLKAAAHTTAAEIALYEILYDVVPRFVLPPIATDIARGWIILPDGGPTLGERLSGDDLLAALIEVMPRYARLQRDLAPHVGRVLATGVPDMRPEIMPARFDEAMTMARAYAARSGTDADRDVLDRLAGFRGTYVEWCDRLAAVPVAAGIDHNDLHAHNILGTAGDASGTRFRAGTRFYDWGDCVVAHPFTSMLVALRATRHALGVADGSPALSRLRTAYLEAFSDIAAPAELAATLELACRVGKVARALIWHRAIQAELDTVGDDAPDGAVPREFADAPLRRLASVLDASYLGAA